VDGNGNVFVSDPNNQRIQKFSSAGAFLGKWGSAGTGNGQFDFPWGIAADNAGNVYVADSGNDRVQKFDANGTFLAKWGATGSGDGQLAFPNDVAVDANGNVYVTDALNHRIQKFSSSGTFLGKWGSQGTGDGQFSFPAFIAARGGKVYVTDSDADRVQVFSETGSFQAKFGSTGTGDGQFSFPTGVAVDASGNVFVAEQDNSRVQKFQQGFVRERRSARNGAVEPGRGVSARRSHAGPQPAEGWSAVETTVRAALVVAAQSAGRAAWPELVKVNAAAVTAGDMGRPRSTLRRTAPASDPG